MLLFAHWVLIAIYSLIPPVAFVVAVRRRLRKRSWRALGGYIVTVCSAVLIGAGVSTLYVVAANARTRPLQVIIAAYFALGLLLILKAVDYVLVMVARRFSGGREWRAVLANLARIGLMVVIAIPFTMAAVMTYRTKVALTEMPTSAYERIVFHAKDGTRLVGWWIPAGDATELQKKRFGDEWARNTVIVCHGLGSNKSNHLLMARWCRPWGYNVFIFDFRAHGESGGQLTTFGIKESEDVLAALDWVKTNRPSKSHKVFGMGASMGGAALIAAAASPRGEGIDAVAVYGSYASLSELADLVCQRQFPPVVRQLAQYVAVPFASLHTGVNLRAFAPEQLIGKIWPRPVLIIHAVNDEVIPFAQGRRLFEAASEPRRAIWMDTGGHNQILLDDGIAQSVMKFFAESHPVPAI